MNVQKKGQKKVNFVSVTTRTESLISCDRVTVTSNHLRNNTFVKPVPTIKTHFHSPQLMQNNLASSRIAQNFKVQQTRAIVSKSIMVLKYAVSSSTRSASSSKNRLTYCRTTGGTSSSTYALVGSIWSHRINDWHRVLNQSKLISHIAKQKKPPSTTEVSAQ